MINTLRLIKKCVVRITYPQFHDNLMITNDLSSINFRSNIKNLCNIYSCSFKIVHLCAYPSSTANTNCLSLLLIVFIVFAILCHIYFSMQQCTPLIFVNSASLLFIADIYYFNILDFKLKLIFQNVIPHHNEK